MNGFDRGKNFDIREFHDWILGSGALPLEVLEKHVDWCIRQAKKRTTTLPLIAAHMS